MLARVQALYERALDTHRSDIGVRTQLA